jgi:hypothetical protein
MECGWNWLRGFDIRSAEPVSSNGRELVNF